MQLFLYNENNGDVIRVAYKDVKQVPDRIKHKYTHLFYLSLAKNIDSTGTVTYNFKLHLILPEQTKYKGNTLETVYKLWYSKDITGALVVWTPA